MNLNSDIVIVSTSIVVKNKEKFSRLDLIQTNLNLFKKNYSTYS